MASIMGYPHHQGSHGNGTYSDTGRKGAQLGLVLGKRARPHTRSTTERMRKRNSG